MPTTKSPTQLTIQFRTVSDRPDQIAFRVTQHAVEAWHRGSLTAWLCRHDLGAWLANPCGELRATAMTFTTVPQQTDDDSGVAITLFGVKDWSVPKDQLEALRRLVSLS